MTKRLIIVLSALILLIALFAITWFYLIAPASILKSDHVMKVNVFARTLWQVGFQQEDLDPIISSNPASSQLDPDYKQAFNKEAMEKIIKTLDSQSRSYYIFNKPKYKQNNYLYILDFDMSDYKGVRLIEEKGITLLVLNKEDELEGKFYGWSYDENGDNTHWFIYKNKELSRVMYELHK